MKLRTWAAAAALGLATFAGCEEAPKNEGTPNNEITGTPPVKQGSPKEEEAGGAGGGGAFTANPTGEVNKNEVPKGYPQPEGIAAPGEGKDKSAEADKPSEEK
jgi:hypothetical protein